jgi:hypothetical protein
MMFAIYLLRAGQEILLNEHAESAFSYVASSGCLIALEKP